MAKTGVSVDSSKKKPETYTIKGTNRQVRANDCVLMRPSDDGKPSYVARVEKIEVAGKNNVQIHCRWFYRPEDSIGGRREFHGAKELFLSDHYDVQSARTIEGKCVVHHYKSYARLKDVGPDDYYYRFKYSALTGAFTPGRIAVYCKCEMPYNPDNLMVQCDDGCKDWFHPACVDMTVEESKKMKHFLCAECRSVKDLKRTQSGPPPNVPKVEAKRRRRR